MMKLQMYNIYSYLKTDIYMYSHLSIIKTICGTMYYPLPHTNKLNSTFRRPDSRYSSTSFYDSIY